jgi:DNA-binding XRE family transcriptional regulator
MNKEKAVDFQEYLTGKLKDKKIRKYYDAYGKQLEVAYQILKIRKEKKLSQAYLAKKLGTRQSNVARMEAGKQNFSTELLLKISQALDCRLKIELVK